MLHADAGGERCSLMFIPSKGDVLRERAKWCLAAESIICLVIKIMTHDVDSSNQSKGKALIM